MRKNNTLICLVLIILSSCTSVRDRDIKSGLANGKYIHQEKGGKVVQDPHSNNIGIANYPIDSSKIGQVVEKPGLINEGGVITKGSQILLPFISDTALTHDKLASDLEQSYPNTSTLITNQGTIIPAYIVNTYGLIGSPINHAYDYLFNNPNETSKSNTDN